MPCLLRSHDTTGAKPGRRRTVQPTFSANGILFLILLAVWLDFFSVSAQECAFATNQDIISGTRAGGQNVTVRVAGEEECCDLCFANAECRFAELEPDLRCNLYSEVVTQFSGSSTVLSPIGNQYPPVETSICEGDTSILTCPPNSEILLESAFYGRDIVDFCRDTDRDVNCSSLKVEEVIRDTCDNQTSCWLDVRSRLLGGDPCPGTDTYLRVNYNCVAQAAVTQPTENGVGGVPGPPLPTNPGGLPPNLPVLEEQGQQGDGAGVPGFVWAIVVVVIIIVAGAVAYYYRQSISALFGRKNVYGTDPYETTDVPPVVKKKPRRSSKLAGWVNGSGRRPSETV